MYSFWTGFKAKDPFKKAGVEMSCFSISFKVVGIPQETIATAISVSIISRKKRAFLRKKIKVATLFLFLKKYSPDQRYLRK